MYANILTQWRSPSLMFGLLFLSPFFFLILWPTSDLMSFHLKRSLAHFTLCLYSPCVFLYWPLCPNTFSSAYAHSLFFIILPGSSAVLLPGGGWAGVSCSVGCWAGWSISYVVCCGPGTVWTGCEWPAQPSFCCEASGLERWSTQTDRPGCFRPYSWSHGPAPGLWRYQWASLCHKLPDRWQQDAKDSRENEVRKNSGNYRFDLNTESGAVKWTYMCMLKLSQQAHMTNKECKILWWLESVPYIAHCVAIFWLHYPCNPSQSGHVSLTPACR